MACAKPGAGSGLVRAFALAKSCPGKVTAQIKRAGSVPTGLVVSGSVIGVGSGLVMF